MRSDSHQSAHRSVNRIRVRAAHCEEHDRLVSLYLTWGYRGGVDPLNVVRGMPALITHGIGTALLHAAEHVAIGRAARALRVETQQVNVPAYRRYERNGLHLECITRGAYRDLRAETQLIWRKSL